MSHIKNGLKSQSISTQFWYDSLRGDSIDNASDEDDKVAAVSIRKKMNSTIVPIREELGDDLVDCDDSKQIDCN